MKFFTLLAAIAAVIPAALTLTVNTPSSVVECEPTLLSWTESTGPYYLSLLPPGQPSGTPIMTLPSQTGTSYTWTVNLAANTNFVIALKDSTGATAYTSTITVQSGGSTSCLSSSASGGSSTPASTSSSGSTTPTGSSSSAVATTPGSSSPVTTTPSASTPSASSAGASPASASPSASGSSTTTNGAGRLSVSTAFGVAGIMGLVGATLF